MQRQHYTIHCTVIAGAVTEIEVLGCGIVSWKPPAGNEGLELGYAIRFFDGPTYERTSLTTGYRRLQRHFSDTGRQWARVDDVPTDGTIVYADVSLSLIIAFGIIYSDTALSDSCTKHSQCEWSILTEICCCQ